MSQAQKSNVTSLFIPANSRRGAQPCFRDGRTSTKSYLIVVSDPTAVEGEPVIAIRPLGCGTYRVHAYPSFAHFGLTGIKQYNRASYGEQYNYDGAEIGADAVKKMLLKAAENENLRVAAADKAFKVAAEGYDPEKHAV